MLEIRLLLTAAILGWFGLSLIAVGTVFEVVRMRDERLSAQFAARWKKLTGHELRRGK